MIIFFADGRLGNQIFQYAFLNTIAKENELIVSTDMKQLSNTFDFVNTNFKQIKHQWNSYINPNILFLKGPVFGEDDTLVKANYLKVRRRLLLLIVWILRSLSQLIRSWQVKFRIYLLTKN
jgi:hypothetical protein